MQEMTSGGSWRLYKRLLGYARPYARMFVFALLAMALAAATEPLFPALLRPLLDSGFAEGGPALSPLLFAAAIVALFFVRGVLTFTSSYCMNWVANKVVLDLRTAMFAKMLRFPARFYDEHPSGTVLSKVAYDVTNVTGAATVALTVVVKDTIAVVGLLAWLFYLNWQLTLIALTVGPLIAWSVRMVARRLRRSARGMQRALGDVVHQLQEAIECQKVVKVFGGQDYEAGRFHARAQALRGHAMRLGVAEALTTPITHILAALALAVVVYIAMQDMIGTRATVGEFASFITATLLLLAPLKRLTDVNALLQRGLAGAESIFGVLDSPEEEDRGTVVLKRARGEVTYEDVWFTYATRAEPALAGIHLHVRPGETLALVGGSGGGKTTLVNLLPRFYAPTVGRILLDGHDIQTLTLQSLRAHIALVSQEIVLFNDSVYANIAYGAMSRATEREVFAAAEAAHALSFIRELPEGFNTLIGQDGLRLSGGQRQRLAIARALLKNAPVLILDEATSALDSESERQVQAALETLMRGRTTIVIAHRLSTIERADRIVVLERGRVVESGRHAELIAKEGVYTRLYRTQYAAQRAAA
jgi:ATP-binding cassette, subfamily B, bacterial MsbA